MAVGTLFNYFPTKEDLGVALIMDAWAAGEVDYRTSRRGDESLEEELFAFIMAGLRRLEEERSFAGEVLEFVFRFDDTGRTGRQAERLHERHAEVVRETLTRHGIDAPAATQMHLYWSLFLGIVRFWARDRSDHLVDTLALADQATRLFASAVKAVPASQEA